MSTFWTMVAALSACAAVTAGLIVHVILYAYHQGRTDNRLDQVERAQQGLEGVGVLLAALTATVEGLKEAVKRLDAAVEALNARSFRNTADKEG